MLARMIRGTGTSVKRSVALRPLPARRYPSSISVFSVLSVVILLFSGCASGGGEGLRTIDEAQLARIERGRTTRAEILEQFGSPSHISASATEGEVFTYPYRAPSASAPGTRERPRSAIREFVVHLKDGVVTDFRMGGGPSPFPPLAVAKPVPPRRRETLSPPPTPSAPAAPAPSSGPAAPGSPDGEGSVREARFVIVLDGLDPARLPDLAAIQDRYPAAFAFELARKGDATQVRIGFDEKTAESAKALLDYLARPPSR